MNQVRDLREVPEEPNEPIDRESQSLPPNIVAI